jgi:hypothetical protein
MADVSCVADLRERISLRPPGRAIKRVGLALAANPAVRCSGRVWLRPPHDRALPGNHRRCVCQSRFHDHPAQSVRVHCGEQPACESRPIAGANRRSRLQGGARPVERGCPRCRSRGSQPRYAALQQPIIEQGTADIAAAPIGNTAAAVLSRTALYPFEILSSLPPDPVQKRLTFAVVRQNAFSASTQRPSFLKGIIQPGDFPWTRKF